jgi:hypothetical protein
MAERDGIGDNQRSREEEYFYKKDRELIERMKQAAATEKTRGELAATTGLTDPALLGELEQLGFTPATVSLLPLVPLVEMAWAEGGVSPAERKLIVDLARSRGIAAGSDADRQLTEWLDRQPPAHVFARATRLIQAMLTSGTPSGRDLSADDLIRYCENIASASGGVFGLGRISAEERAILTKVAAALKGK